MPKINKVRVVSLESTRKGDYLYLLVNTDSEAFVKALSDTGMDEDTHYTQLSSWLATYFGMESVDEVLFRVYNHFSGKNSAVDPEVEVCKYPAPTWSIINKSEGLVELQVLVRVS